tara:strand:- start:204 stop:605 length:402 start_codon:yes stop_codon:yes gene_type:complete
MIFSEIRAFYKGNHFPLIIGNQSEDEWKAIINHWNHGMIQTLKDGHSLEEQAKTYVKQLDTANDWLNEISTEMKNGSRTTSPTKEELETLCQTRFGESFTFIQVLWYMNVYYLLKLKKIENDDMNGWMFITKK